MVPSTISTAYDVPTVTAESETLNALFIPCYVDGLPVESGSVTWRCRWPAKYWPKVVPDELYTPGRADVYDGTQRLSDYQVFVFQKAYRAAKSRGWILELAQIRDSLEGRTKVLVLDMCDPDWLDGKALEQLLTILPRFDLATGPTDPLVKWMGQYLPAYEVQDGIDPDVVHYQHKPNGGDPSVCWIGYSGNYDALRWLHADLQRAKVDVEVIEIDRPVAFDMFLRTLSRYDILLNPQPPRPPYLYKSANKSDAAWMTGVAVVEKPGELEPLMDPLVREAAIQAHQGTIRYWRNAERSAEALWDAVLCEILERRPRESSRD